MTPPPGPDGPPRATRVQRLRVGLLEAAAWLANRLPASVVGGAADAAGELWYRVTPARAAQARANLGRVVTHLAATGARAGARRRRPRGARAAGPGRLPARGA